MSSEAWLSGKQRLDFGLSVEQADALNDTERCPICLRPFSRGVRRPVIDHDHRTGLVRGLLCVSCNTFVGTVHDDAGKMRRLADYLDDPPAPDKIGRHFVPNSPGAAGHYT